MLSSQEMDLIKLGCLSVASFCTVFYLFKKLDPTIRTKNEAREQTNKIIKRLKYDKTKNLSTKDFNEYELVISSHLIHPDDIDIKWSDIAGIDTIIEEIKQTVITPIIRRDLIAKSNLSQPPKGVLLFGPPGCGKTMIAKAIAKESSLPFINLDVSTLTDKWYGESQKLATAVFSAAKKLSPCIIFIDEIESILRSRNTNDHEATAMMKTQFMIHWDGLITDKDCHVIIMGATNRPEDIDKAFLRRMPAAFNIPLPTTEQRQMILQKILHAETMDATVNFERLAVKTDGFSGADLRELCRTASLYRFNDIDPNCTQLRSISMSDLMSAVKKVKREVNAG